jgi:cell fate regulator YaaT (PSP1 superfamily)
MLVKKLAALFKTRIEMRQIGVRDAAKIQGGYGVCGIICCCARSNCHMNSIFLKMAKDQGFVVNSSKLTGLCGRLMCCLAYENDFYVEEKKKYPNLGSIVTDGKNKYKIISVNILRDEIFASDEMHHQRKFPHSAIEFMRKDEHGVPMYKLHLEPE